ncbi:MAG: PEP-CTERM sorting domain-containing protein [Planctomycetes bacterium]|nr:PEP-CTERM sorting domain-containing protein [Planctomycetota bacterium]
MIWDVYIPDLNWTPLFNTNFNHANDADLYVAGNGAVGIGALGYSAAGEVREDTWHRIGIVHDRDAGTVKYFVDGTEIFSGGAGGTDGRHSLYTGSHAGLDMLVDGEGDGSGNYSNEVYLSSFLFSDVAFDPAMMADLGGVTAAGIALSPEAAVPEPSALVLLGLGIAALAIFRRRRRGAN